MNDGNSSPESDDEISLFDDDERSSHTSYDNNDHQHHPQHEKPVIRRGSLVPHRRSSVNKRQHEPTYREHHRGSSYPTEAPRRLEEPRRRRESRESRESRYLTGDRVETIIERRPRRHSSRDRRESLQYFQPPKRLEHQPRSPPLTPISNSSRSYSPHSSRRYSGLAPLSFPHEWERERERERERDRDRDRETERRAEEYIHAQDFRAREEAVKRREREVRERDAWERERREGLEGGHHRGFGGGSGSGRIGGGEKRYWPR